MESASEGNTNGFGTEAGVVIAMLRVFPNSYARFSSHLLPSLLKNKHQLNAQLERQIWQTGISWLDN